MKNTIFTIIMLVMSVNLLAHTLEDDIVNVDCFTYADAVEGAAGDGGDFDVWWRAFVYCSGVDEVVIN